MSGLSSPSGVDTEPERAFHERFYWISRSGQFLLAVLIVAVGMGLVGNGPISWSEASDGELTVSYERFMRRGSPWTMGVEVAAAQDTVEVAVSRDFHAGQQLAAVTPQPDSVTVSPDVVTYAFATGPGTDRVRIEFEFTADDVGWKSAEVGLAGDGPTVSFRQLLYP